MIRRYDQNIGLEDMIRIYEIRLEDMIGRYNREIWLEDIVGIYDRKIWLEDMIGRYDWKIWSDVDFVNINR